MTPTGITTDLTAVDANDEAARDVSPAGSVTSSSRTHPEKAVELIVLSEAGKSIAARETQSWKAYVPIEVMFPKIVTDFKLEQYLKTLLPIEVIPEGILTEAMPL